MPNLFRAFVLTIFALLVAPGQGLADTQITNQWNVYSPSLIRENGQMVMYYGGWGNEQHTAPLPNDTIYRSVCTTYPVCSSAASWSAAQAVIVPQNSGMGARGLVNDPSVVAVGDYLIMYMTGVADANDPTAGYTVANNNIYFSTSWANDGVNWSAPQLLLSTAWLPSATVGPSGDVLLYANSNVTGELYQYDLGAGGVTPGTPNLVHYYDPASGNELGVSYANIDIAWMPQISAYQMLGQKGDQTQIDYLQSTDGVNFYLMNPGIITTSDGVNSPVITPIAWPDSFCWVYYAQGVGGELNFNIFYHTWC